MAFKSGMGFEDRLRAHLEKVGYDVEQDELLNHEYKIDLSIRRFPQNPKHYSLGLQVTQRCDELGKLQEFLNVHSSGFQVVDRVLYVEVEASDFERGVGHLVSTAISSFQFDERFHGMRTTGVKILSSMHLQFFDIKGRIAELASKASGGKVPLEAQPLQQTTVVAQTNDKADVATKIDLAAATTKLNERLNHKKVEKQSEAQERELIGFINGFYRTKGEGFITAQDGDSYYFRLEGVSDGKLRDRLINLPSFEYAVPIEGTISFISVGRTKPNAKYEEARSLKFIAIK